MMKLLQIISLVICMIYVNSKPVKDKAAEIRKYKTLYLENQRNWTKLGLSTFELDILQLKKWSDFDAKWADKTPKGVDVKKWKRQKALAEKKLRFEIGKKWRDLNKEEIKLGNEAQTINEALKDLTKANKSHAKKTVTNAKVKKAPKSWREYYGENGYGEWDDELSEMMMNEEVKDPTPKMLLVNNAPNSWWENYGEYGEGEWNDENSNRMITEEVNDPKPKKLLPNKPKVMDAKKGPVQKTVTKAKVEKAPKSWWENYGEYGEGEWDDKNSNTMISKEVNDPKPKKLLPKKAKVVDAKKGPVQKTVTKVKVEKVPMSWWKNYEEYDESEWDEEYSKAMINEEVNDPKPKQLLPKKAKVVDAKKGPVQKTVTKAKVEKAANSWWKNYEAYGDIDLDDEYSKAMINEEVNDPKPKKLLPKKAKVVDAKKGPVQKTVSKTKVKKPSKS